MWQVVEVESGESYMVPRVPTWAMVLEYMIKSCTGHPTTPKGGTKEYRSGPWYKHVFGKVQGERMGKKKVYGHGAYADKKMRFTTIEQKWSHLKKWYDNALKNTQIANPARNTHIEKARGLGLRLGSGVRSARVGLGKGERRGRSSSNLRQKH